VSDYFPVVIEREDNGTYSAWVAGVPGVYAAADTMSVAKRSIRNALVAHLAALRELGRTPKPKVELLVLSAKTGAISERLRFTGPAALLGRHTSVAKAAAARRNGRKGGRPRKSVATTKARRTR
jgi:predicted RNase H-like HicB family nuclease